MSNFTLRNLRILFRDHALLCFSLLSSLLVMGLYLLFLRSVHVSNFKEIPEAALLMDRWLMAGLLCGTSMSAAMGAFSIMVWDREEEIDKDFFAAPIAQGQLTGGYLCSGLLVSLLITLLTFGLLQLFFWLRGVPFLTGRRLTASLLSLLLTVLANGAMSFFGAACFKSGNGYSAAGTVAGTLMGFFTGVYLPIGMLPEGARWLVRCFPPAHGAALLRQAFMAETMADSFRDIPAKELAGFQAYLGVRYRWADALLPSWGNILILSVTALLFISAACFLRSRRKN